MTSVVTGVARRCSVFLAAVILTIGAAPTETFGQQDDFTPIISGMKLLSKGAPAPAFKIFDLGGEEYDSALRQKGKNYIVVFFSLFCEPCREEMPIVEQIYKEYQDKGLDVMAISMDGPPFKEAIQSYVNANEYSFPFLLDTLGDEDFVAAGPFQVPGTPVLYLIDTDGKIFAGHLGRIMFKDLKALVDSMLDKG